MIFKAYELRKQNNQEPFLLITSVLFLSNCFDTTFGLTSNLFTGGLLLWNCFGIPLALLTLAFLFLK